MIRVFTSPLSLRELYPADRLPNPTGVPAPILPQSAQKIDQMPAVGLTIYNR